MTAHSELLICKAFRSRAFRIRCTIDVEEELTVIILLYLEGPYVPAFTKARL
jgi:hypothetical protein